MIQGRFRWGRLRGRKITHSREGKKTMEGFLEEGYISVYSQHMDRISR